MTEIRVVKSKKKVFAIIAVLISIISAIAFTQFSFGQTVNKRVDESRAASTGGFILNLYYDGTDHRTTISGSSSQLATWRETSAHYAAQQMSNNPTTWTLSSSNTDIATVSSPATTTLSSEVGGSTEHYYTLEPTVTLKIPEGYKTSTATVVDKISPANEVFGVSSSFQSGKSGNYSIKIGGRTCNWGITTNREGNDYVYYNKDLEVKITLVPISTITFNPNGGTFQNTTGTSTKDVAYDTLYPEVGVATRTGYSFSGWYDSEDRMVFDNTGTGDVEEGCSSFYYRVEMSGGGQGGIDRYPYWDYIGDVSVIAKWTEKTATLNYYNGGLSDATVPSSETMKYTEATSAATASATGYTFLGWATSLANARNGTVKYFPNGTIKAANVDPTESSVDKKLYAVWKSDLTYNTAHGNAPETQTMKYNSAVTANSGISATGYTFNGWYDNPSFTGTNYAGATVKEENTFKPNTTLYAKWEEKTATLSYNTDGKGTAPSATTQYYSTQTKVTTTKPTATGYTFAGWHGTQNSARNGTVQYTDGAVYKNANETPTDATLYAVWYGTLSYNNGGAAGATLPESKKMYYNSAVTAGSATGTAGLDFKGWATTLARAQAGTVDYTSGASIKTAGSYKADMTLYAVWDASTYELTLNKNDGSGTSSTKSVKYQMTQNNTLSVPTRTDYIFNGWWTSGTLNQGTMVFDNTGHYTTNGGYWTSDGKWNRTSGLTLYAQWEYDEEYSITYTLNGGTLPNGHPTSYKKTQQVTLMNPTQTGYTFDGWKGNGNPPDTKQTTVTIERGSTGDRKYIAYWNANTYSLSYDYAGGEAGEHAPDSGIYNTQFEVSNPTKTGYTFTGWTISEMDNVLHNYGSETTTNNTINSTKATTFKNLRATSGTVKFKANWTKNTYRINYDLNNGTAGQYAPPTGTYDTEVNISNPTRTGYVFTGWKITGMDNVEHVYGTERTTESIINSTKATTFMNLHSASNANVNFTAQWQANGCAITFNGNKPSGADSVTTIDNVTVVYGSDANNTVGKAKSTGYIFQGWYTNGGAQVYNNEGEFVSGEYWTNVGNWNKDISSLTLYAHWTPIKYNIVYSANSGEGSLNSHTNVEYTEEVTLRSNGTGSSAAMTKTGYKFNGWNTKANGIGGTAIADGATVSKLSSNNGETVTLYAQWTPINYKVRFNKNGSTEVGTMADQSFVYDGDTTQLTKNVFTRYGYTFDGWMTTPAPEQETRYYTDEHPVKNLSATDGDIVMLYAKWVPVEYDVHFNANGGNGTMSDQHFAWDEEKNLSKNLFTRTGWIFVGWTTERYGEEKDTPDYQDEESVKNLPGNNIRPTVVLYALWMSADAYSLPPITVSGIKFREIQTENGESSFEASLKDGQEFFVPGIDLGAKYTVTEKGERDYTPAFKYSEGKATAAKRKGETSKNLATNNEVLRENASVDYTNVHEPKTTEITLSKAVTGNLATEADRGKLFTFRYSFTGLENNAVYDIEKNSETTLIMTADNNGKAIGTITLSDGEMAVFTELPEDVTYQFEEILRTDLSQPERYKASFDVTSGDEYTNTDNGEGESLLSGGGYGLATGVEITQGQPVSFRFNNSVYDYHDVKVKKEVMIDEKLNTDIGETFYINVEFNGLERNTVYTYTGGSFTSDSSGNGTANLTLKSDEEITINQIPGKAGIIIREVKSAYKPSITIKDDDGVEVETLPDDLYSEGLEDSIDSIESNLNIGIQNSRNTRNNLTVRKLFLGPLAKPQDTARFIIDLDGLEKSKEYNVTKSVMGALGTEGVKEEFILTPGNSFTYTLLTNSADSTVSVSKGSESFTVPVSNGNKITLNQSQIEQLLDENEDGSVYVTYHTQGNTETSTIPSSLKGEAVNEFELKPYEQITINGLPKDSVYKIKETGKAGVEASYVASNFSHLELNNISDNAEKGKDISTPQETMAFDREYTFINENPFDNPTKTVSDDDNIMLNGVGEETDVSENTVKFDKKSRWTYHLKQDVPSAMNSFAMKDSLPQFVTFTLVDEDGSTGRKPATFFWTIGENRYGGTAEVAPDESEADYIVKQGNRIIFEIYANEDSPTDDVEIYLVDKQLLASGGTFEAYMESSLVEGTKAENLRSAGYSTPYGYKVRNEAFTLINDSEYEAKLADTNLIEPKGLTVRKQVTEPGDKNESFAFTLELSGLREGDEYTYEYPSIINAELSYDGENISIFGKNTNGKTIKDITANIYDENEDVVGSIISGRKDADVMKLGEGVYTAQISYGNGTPVEISFRIDEDDDTEELVIKGQNTASLSGGGVTGQFYCDANGKATIPFNLKSEESIQFTNLPVDATYEITEAASSYKASYMVTYNQSAVAASARSKENTKINKELSTGENTIRIGRPVVFEFTNTIPSKNVKFSKTRVNGTNELPGAELTLVKGEFHPNGNTEEELRSQEIVDSWISTETQHEKELSYGETYTLVEVAAPTHYELAEEIVFRITESGTIQVLEDGEWKAREIVHMKDEQKFDIFVEKRDNLTEAFVVGAELSLYGPDNRVIGESWLTTNEGREFKDLKPGNYRIVEVDTPASGDYLQALPVTFTITNEGLITNVEGPGSASGNVVRMYDEYDPEIDITKYDINGTEEVNGARLVVSDISHTEYDYDFEIDSWTSGNNDDLVTEGPYAGKHRHKIHLVAGREYRLTETIAPALYDQAESIVFKVSSDSEVLIKQNDGTFVNTESSELIMLDAPSKVNVDFSKTEINLTDELPGAELEIHEGSETGIITKDAITSEDASWTSTNTQKRFSLLEGKTYTMVEKTAPNGYDKAESITFRITDDQKIEIFDSETSSWNEQSENLVHMEDRPTEINVDFSKYDVNGTGELEGAFLEIHEGETASGPIFVDSEGVEAKWTSSGNVQKRIKLYDNHTYTMVEQTPPNYYEAAESITFRIINGKVEIKQGNSWVEQAQNLVRMKDDRSTTKVKFSKVDINTSSELPGAHLEIKKGEDTTVRVSGGDLIGYCISLSEKNATTYTLKVTKPDGTTPANGAVLKLQGGSSYTMGANGTFDVTKNTYTTLAGKEMLITYNGITESSHFPSGVSTAETLGNGYSWVSTTTQKEFTLEEGRTYTMIETQSPTEPEEFKISESIIFRIDDDGNVEIKNNNGEWVQQNGKIITMVDEPNKTYDIYLKKKVTGDLGDLTKKFEFTVEFTDLVPGKEYNRLSDKSTPADLKTITANAEGKVTVEIKLRSGEQVIFGGINSHAHYKVTEKPSDHVASYTIAGTGDDPLIVKNKDSNGNVSAKALSTSLEETDKDDGDIYIVFKNNRDLATITSVSSYLRIWIVGAVILMVLGTLYIWRRRKLNSVIETLE